MRYLAIDHGQKRTGLAVCDADETLASPLEVIEGQGELVPRIITAIEEQQAEAVVLGLPLNMDDTEGPAVKKIYAFAEVLRKHVDIPILFYDERLSSFEAEGKFAGGGLTRKKKKNRLDAVAAAMILQSFLDNKHSQ